MKENLTGRFIDEFSNCNDPSTFIGLARLLGVQLLTDQKDKNDHFIARDFSEIALDVVNKFQGLERKRKKELLKIFKEANRTKIPEGNA